jgi:hypothetical protein
VRRWAGNALAAALWLAAAPVAAIVVPGTGGKLDIGGWVDGRAVVDTGGGAYEPPWGRLLLTGDGDLGHDLAFRFQLLGQVGGPYRNPNVGFWNFNDSFENDSPSLQADEAYLKWQPRDFDLRAGLQLFAWGKLDGIPPSDVLNPRSYHDPLVDDVEERKIGVPAVSGTYYVPLPSGGLLSRLETQLVYVPFAVPPRLALERERWFPSSIGVPSEFSVQDLKDQGIDLLAHDVPVSFHTKNRPPTRQFEDGGIGLRIGGTLREVDWDLYYYDGPETGPDARLQATALCNFANPSGPRCHAISHLVQEQDRMHLFGADTAFVLGPLSLRGELVYSVNRPYLRPGTDVVDEGLQTLARRIDKDPTTIGARNKIPLPDLFVNRNAVEWGIGADTVWNGFIPLVQISQIVLTEDAPRLLIGQPETRITALVRKPILQDRVEFEVRTIYSIEAGGWFALPRVSYAPVDNVRLRVGYLAVGGHVESLIGQFKQNDEVLFEARYSF